MSIGNVVRSTPGNRPPVLFLDPTIGVDTFKFGTGLCDGRSVSADQVQMRLYVAGCEPAVFVRRGSCTCQSKGVCDFCSAWEWPAELSQPRDRGGWPPRDAGPQVDCDPKCVIMPALEIGPGGCVSFQYDSVVYDFVRKYYTRQLVGIFFLDCHPGGVVRFITDPRVRPVHIKREVNFIHADCDSDCLVEPECSTPVDAHPVREACCPTVHRPKPLCDKVKEDKYYDYSFDWSTKCSSS